MTAKYQKQNIIENGKQKTETQPLKMFSSSLISKQTGALIPDDVMRIIFGYLSDISESGWHYELGKRRTYRLVVNPRFVGIRDIFQFKTNYLARYVKLKIQQWQCFHSNVDQDQEDAQEKVVNALEVPHRIHNQATINANLKNGIVYDSRCYTYVDPETQKNMTAYVDSCKHSTSGNAIFQQGCVYPENGEAMVISGFGSDETPGTAKIVVNSLNINWDYDGDLDWLDDEMDSYDEDGDGDDGEEIPPDFDLNALPPLQMYM